MAKRKLDFNALDVVSGGMDMRSLQAHMGSGHAQAGGPGFAPLLGQGAGGYGLDPNMDPSMGAGGVGMVSGYGNAPLQNEGGLGLDPYAQGAQYQGQAQMPYSGATQAQPEHRSSFAENVQAITGIVQAFAGIVGAFSGQGGAQAGGQEQPQGRMMPQREGGDDQGLGAGEGEGQGQGQGDETFGAGQGAEPTGMQEPTMREPTGGNTNFRETETGFERT